MGIYIPKEFPKNCNDCPCTSGWNCFADDEMRDIAEYDDNHTKPDWCPLIEVPKHGRLGDLDRLEQMFVDIDNAPYSAFDGEEPFYTAEDAAQIIRLAPTIIESEEMNG